MFYLSYHRHVKRRNGEKVWFGRFLCPHIYTWDIQTANLLNPRGDFTVRLIEFKLPLAGSVPPGRDSQVTALSISVSTRTSQKASNDVRK